MLLLTQGSLVIAWEQNNNRAKKGESRSICHIQMYRNGRVRNNHVIPNWES